jgi:predicted aldo/keto reductase-like oxidoreductase
MPCPEGIDVPRFFEIYNDAAMYEDVETARSLCIRERIYPEDCTECRHCEARCTKRLPMVDWLARGRSFLGLT